jgi:hypothetical protein
MPLTLGQQLTTAQLATATAGGYNYIRTKRGQVRGLAYKIRDNHYAPTAPGQPGIIVFGTGSRRKASAWLFLNSQAVVPAFIKRGTNNWEHIGDYRAASIAEDPITIRKYCGKREPATQAGVLFITPVSLSLQLPVVDVVGGGFGTPESRKAVEKAAIKFVTKILKERGFVINNVERDNLGYDLSAVKSSTVLQVEVKGTDSPQPRFFVTRNEARAADQHEEWKLFVVCQARSAPVLHEYTVEEMRRTFAFEPLAWECVKMSKSVTSGKAGGLR